MHSNSLLIYKKYALPLLHPETHLLEIGPDQFPASSYKQSTPNAPRVWDTLELFNHPSLTYVSKDQYHFPVAENSYDIILAGQVLEHVRKPWLWIMELARICKPGGKCIIITPLSWPYHEAPVDCWRLYPEAYRSLCEDVGLRVDLAKFECLELPDYPHKHHGFSADCIPPKKLRLKKILKQKIECALDTICIATKL